MFKMSLRQVLMAVGFVAVALVALLNASTVWCSVILSGTLLVMLISVVASFSCRDAKRGFWVGFSVFGWGYLLLTLGPPSLFAPGAGMLATHKSLEAFYTAVRENPVQYGVYNDDDPFAQPSQLFGEGIAADWSDFQQIGHALWALVLALAGGKVGLYFYTAPERGSRTK